MVVRGKEDGWTRGLSPPVVELRHRRLFCTSCWPMPVAKQTSDSPSSTDLITYGVHTNDLSKLEVRLRKLIALISEQTDRGVLLSTAWPSELSDDHSKSSVLREHLLLPVPEEGYRQGPSQGLHSVYCPQQPLTDSAMCYRPRGDDRHAS